MHRLAPRIAFWMALFGWQSTLAAGTPANTAITTQATVEYTIGDATLTQTSNAVTASVAELLNVHSTWQDSTLVVAHPVDKNRILTFRVTNTGTDSPGDALSGMGDGGTDAIFGVCGASANVTGTYAISNAHLSVVKSATVLDPQGGIQPATGAVITYQVRIHVNDTSTARTVVLSDPIPTNTTYRPQSLHFNGTQLSDAPDSDAGDVNASATKSVPVNLGDLAASSAVQSITFEVTINLQEAENDTRTDDYEHHHGDGPHAAHHQLG